MLNVEDIDRTARHEGVVSTSFLVPGHLTQGLLSYLYGLPLSSSNGKYFSFKTKKKKKKRIFLMFFAFFIFLYASFSKHPRVSRLPSVSMVALSSIHHSYEGVQRHGCRNLSAQSVPSSSSTVNTNSSVRIMAARLLVFDW